MSTTSGAQALAFVCQIDPKKAPALETISTALPTSVPSSKALILVGLAGGVTMPLGAGRAVVLAEEGGGGGTGIECFKLETGEFAGVGCLDLCSCSSSVSLRTGMGIGVVTSGSESKLSVDIRKGLLP